MPRLMSCSETTQQVRDRTKTVTRRLGWWEDKNGRRMLRVGDRLTLCEKVMGRRRQCDACRGSGLDSSAANDCQTCGGDRAIVDPLVRLAEVEVVDVYREPLWHIAIHDVFTDLDAPRREVAAEGFPTWSPDEFMEFFCDTFKVDALTEVTRIEFRYLDDEVPS